MEPLDSTINFQYEDYNKTKNKGLFPMWKEWLFPRLFCSFRKITSFFKKQCFWIFAVISIMETNKFIVQEATPLRNSIIWDLQNQFYMKKGASCWTDSIVPHFVTSNSYIAYQYANCILGYIRDYYNS